MLGRCRDAYYKHHRRAVERKKCEDCVIEFISQERLQEPVVGVKKLFYRSNKELEQNGVRVGRDRFLTIARNNDLFVEMRRKYERTTYSHHAYAVAPNRVKNLEVTRPDQVLVSDITYLRLAREFAYLFLVTDRFSRKILGYHLSSSLAHTGAVKALQMATDEIPDTRGVIHHSDRGCQYCCHEFLKELQKCQMVPSMTDASHCYQNAIAERVNGILKQEFFLDATFQSFRQAQCAVENAICIYNYKRTHWSLKLKTPETVYREAA